MARSRGSLVMTPRVGFPRRDRRGFTLVEMLVVSAVTGIFCVVLSQALMKTVQFVRLYTAKVELSRDSRICMTQVIRLLRQAKASTVTLSQSNGEPWMSRVDFSTSDGRTIVFRQSGRKLIMENGPQSVILTSNLQQFFVYFPQMDQKNAISLSLGLSKPTAWNQSATNLTSTKKITFEL